MQVLGPFKFTEDDAADACGCGGDYCTPFQDNDVISFQIPSSENCCGPVTGCYPTITENCFDSLSFDINTDYSADVTYGNAGICFNTETSFPTPDYIFQFANNIVSGTKYRVTVCVSGNDLDLEMELFVGSAVSSPFTGNGTFSAVIEAVDTGAAIDVGIQHTGADNGVILCFGCFTICEAKTWTAVLVDEDDATVLELAENNLNNGNISVTGEIDTASTGTGCMRIKLTNDCDEEVLYSQCLMIREAYDCTLLLKWRDDKNVFGFDYLTNLSYYNYLRVKARLKNPTFPTEKGIFRLSDNSNVLTNAVVQKKSTVQLTTPGVPDFVHQAIALALVHQTFLIDGTTYVVDEGGYEPAWRKSSDLSVSVFEVIAQDFDGVNSYCG